MSRCDATSASDENSDAFNLSSAELFEALGHPTRIRITQVLARKPLAFAELKRATGIESNGLLTFHLGKLSGLVKLDADGAYALTEHGKEALRIIDTSRRDEAVKEKSNRPSRSPIPHPRTIIACLVIALLVFASVSIIEYNQVQSLDSKSLASASSVNYNRSGPISSFPLEWINPCSPSLAGNTTTGLYLDLNISSVFDHINLSQVYPEIVSSSVFQEASQGYGWVTTDWTATQGENTVGAVTDTVLGMFVLIKDAAPAGYVAASYNLVNESVSIQYQAALAPNSCPT